MILDGKFSAGSFSIPTLNGEMFLVSIYGLEVPAVLITESIYQARLSLYLSSDETKELDTEVYILPEMQSATGRRTSRQFAVLLNVSDDIADLRRSNVKFKLEVGKELENSQVKTVTPQK